MPSKEKVRSEAERATMRLGTIAAIGLAAMRLRDNHTEDEIKTALVLMRASNANVFDWLEATLHKARGGE